MEAKKEPQPIIQVPASLPISTPAPITAALQVRIEPPLLSPSPISSSEKKPKERVRKPRKSPKSLEPNLGATTIILTKDNGNGLRIVETIAGTPPDPALLQWKSQIIGFEKEHAEIVKDAVAFFKPPKSSPGISAEIQQLKEKYYPKLPQPLIKSFDTEDGRFSLSKLLAPMIEGSVSILSDIVSECCIFLVPPSISSDIILIASLKEMLMKFIPTIAERKIFGLLCLPKNSVLPHGEDSYINSLWCWELVNPIILEIASKEIYKNRREQRKVFGMKLRSIEKLISKIYSGKNTEDIKKISEAHENYLKIKRRETTQMLKSMEKKSKDEEKRKKDEEKKKKEEEKKRKEEEKKKKDEEKKKKDEEKKKKDEEKKLLEEQKAEERKRLKEEQKRLKEEKLEERKAKKRKHEEILNELKNSTEGVEGKKLKEGELLDTQGNIINTEKKEGQKPITSFFSVAKTETKPIQKVDKIIKPYTEFAFKPPKFQYEKMFDRETFEKALLVPPIRKLEFQSKPKEKIVHKANNSKKYIFIDDAQLNRGDLYKSPSKIVNSRRPFAKDPQINYELDTDEEYEELFGEEIISSGDEEKDEDDISNNEDNWLVPDGYLSPEERSVSIAEDSQGEEELRKRKFAVTENKRDTEIIILNIKNISEVFKNFMAQNINGENFPIEATKKKEIIKEEEQVIEVKKVKIKIEGEILVNFVKMVHGSYWSIRKMAEEFQKLYSEISGRIIRKKIQEIAVKEKRGEDLKKRYYVNQEFLPEKLSPAEILVVFTQNGEKSIQDAIKEKENKDRIRKEKMDKNKAEEMKNVIPENPMQEKKKKAELVQLEIKPIKKGTPEADWYKTMLSMQAALKAEIFKPMEDIPQNPIMENPIMQNPLMENNEAGVSLEVVLGEEGKMQEEKQEQQNIIPVGQKSISEYFGMAKKK